MLPAVVLGSLAALYPALGSSVALCPAGEKIFNDEHDGDQKAVSISTDRSVGPPVLTIRPHNNDQKWIVTSPLDQRFCNASIDFAVPGKPNPPPVNLTVTFWALERPAMTKSALIFTDPSGKLAAPDFPLNTWVQLPQKSVHLEGGLVEPAHVEIGTQKSPMLAIVLTTPAFKLPAVQTEGLVLNRRTALSSAAAAYALGVPSAALALKPCPSGSQNCFSTASTGKNQLTQWEWPSGMSRSDATKSLREVLNAYPQSGQSGVDGGGWTLIDDSLDASGYAKFEFKSSGTGNLAKFFNGGKPFTDDLEVSVEDTFVCARSSSRVGDSDFGVNTKRINYIAAALREKGWKAEGVKAS